MNRLLKLFVQLKKSIVLIDTYVDDITLTHLFKKQKEVNAWLPTKNTSKQLTFNIQKANEQYGNFELKIFTQSHDRFLIVDQTEVYHLGPSLKDLGKKWFAFSKKNKASVENILNSILGLI